MKYKLTPLQLAGNKQVKDAYALLDLLNEHEHTRITMTFSRAYAGHARDRHFIMPIHVFDKGETYLFYYVIHEFTHCLGYARHDSDFKRSERRLLNLFDIDIDYARAYPRALYANGEKVYQKKTVKRITPKHDHIYSITKFINGKAHFYCHFCRREM